MFTTSMCWWQIRPRHPPDPRGGRFHITSSYWESLPDGCWSGLSKLRCCKILKIITSISFNLWIHHQFVFWATCLFFEVTNRLLGVSVNGQVSRGSFPTAPDKVRKNETLMFKNNILMLKHIFAEIKFRSPTPTLQTLISIWMFEIMIEKFQFPGFQEKSENSNLSLFLITNVLFVWHKYHFPLAGDWKFIWKYVKVKSLAMLPDPVWSRVQILFKSFCSLAEF